MLVCTLGDLVLDVVVRLDAPLAPGDDVAAQTTVGPGGQAANVAAWAAALGARARFVGVLAEDGPGRLAAEGLGRHGVELCGPRLAGPGGVVVSLVSPNGERALVSDRGAAAGLRAGDVDPAWLEDCDHLHVSGYALAAEPARTAARRAVELARARGARVSVDVSAASVLAAIGHPLELLAGLAPDAVFCTELEERTLGGRLAGAAWIVKRGARGASFDVDQRSALPVERAVDAPGAGDAPAAGWIVGGPELALEAAARCVARQGAMPPLA